jgi:hypothetical protein
LKISTAILLTSWRILIVTTDWESRLDLTNRSNRLTNWSSNWIFSSIVRTCRLNHAASCIHVASCVHTASCVSLIRRKLLMILNLLSTKIHIFYVKLNLYLELILILKS